MLTSPVLLHETDDPALFRRVLGHCPAGVVGITAVDQTGGPVGLVVSSFTSVSLDPPLVAFLPTKSSTTFPKIRDSGSFCANVLAAAQRDLCRAFAVSGGDKFAGVDWSPGPTGSPILAGAVAWIDCDIDAVHDAGDHEIVVGRVRALAAEPADPSALVFFRGGYRAIASEPSAT
ncbi:flavin reductase family protein [Saccharopolyspora phatthalungensis]|uniref:Flavin reductase (DIM6/NTAB) family NADH-FMN oxidoreductase RutF n=1 Tax=Saccharopolyspora phatthalungensis TaxID=664693 RepID=A0A840Q9P4_9PSEU|nr:flavin reductase family protein [Saccharopolyspora phatthalungensis]MBB5153523.1 flavin reductase (DIM6/NTAB) family NADH-FMN oxidoreductase RutF [Saccharopolyspora phatthalungensis]